MSFKIDTTEDGALDIRQGGPWYQRLLGLPMVAYGVGYFGYILIDAIVEYVRAGASASEWLGAMPGMVLIVVFGGIFAAPGLFLCLSARRAVLDRGQGEAREYGVFRRWRVHRRMALDAVEKVRIESTRSTSGSGSSRRTSNHNEVVLESRGKAEDAADKPAKLRLAVFGSGNDDVAQANDVGNQVAEFLGLDFKPKR